MYHSDMERVIFSGKSRKYTFYHNDFVVGINYYIPCNSNRQSYSFY